MLHMGVPFHTETQGGQTEYLYGAELQKPLQ
jgi:hypothetical protein